LITAKQKRSRGKLLVTVIILGLVVGGTSTLILLQETGVASVTPDFTMVLKTGNFNDAATWSNITTTHTILNETSGLDNSGVKIIIYISSQGTFDGFIRLNVSGLPPGIAFSFRPLVLRTVAGGNAASALTLRAAANVTSQPAPYNVTVTATSSSPAITHAVSFPLRVRSTKLFWSPLVLSVTKGEKFTLSLQLSDVYNVTSFQFSGDFNSTLITAMTNGTIFNHDFSNYGFIVQQDPSATPPCLWVNNSTGTLGNCGMGASFLGQCASAPCITVNATQTFNLLNQTFVANTNYDGITPVTLRNDVIVEAMGEVIIPNDPHHTVGGLVTVAEIGHASPPVSQGESISSLYGPLGLFLLSPLIFRSLARRPRHRIS